MHELDVRKENSLIAAFEQADNILTKKYVSNLSDYEIVPVPDELESEKVSAFTRLFQVDRIVYDQEENNQDKLSNVYNAMAGCGGSLVMIADSDGEKVSFYIGAKSGYGSVTMCQSVLGKSLKGNFPGIESMNLKNSEIESVMKGLFTSGFENSPRQISVVSGIPGLRASLNDADKKGFVQGLEKLIEAMRGEKYSLILVADPVSQDHIETVKGGYEKLYSDLMPFASTELGFNSSESSAVSDSITTGLSKSINESLSKTQSYSTGSASSKSETKSSSISMGFSSSVNAGISFIVNAGASASVNTGYTKGNATTAGLTESFGKTDSEATTTGTVNTTSEQKGTSNTFTDGRGRSLQIKFENKAVKNLLEKIDDQIKRLSECSDLGMWNCSAYLIADDIQTSKVAASTFHALMRGENSSIENAAINTWTEKNKTLAVSSYLKKLHHPLINLSSRSNSGLDMPCVTPTALLSGKELTIQAGFPQKSIPGLAVIEHISFGREILSRQADSGESFSLGNIFHMGKKESLKVNMHLQSLSSHTFITGSTGAGKSNTVYKILSELNKKKVSFLIIEPAKGEYKNIFGHRKDVNVFGTNPKISPLLRINPFKFPSGIHVLEHADRLVEIFNVCWPMYAAMPAVLKEAIEQAYVSSGWDLDSSENRLSDDLFPTFADVLVELDRVISGSAYSEELKSNYRGALFTRIKSLTNGLNGRIFCSTEVDNSVLFDSNTIVDLSRIGSMETRSMIMGILVMRLQEHRISRGGMNLKLQHVTVLEEAHNLLKRTSTEQSSESSNLIGKSVEMLTNAIAEMRTYGEGFIIADQSPGLLDISVIRNTNTKIILRLPDASDRELVGKAATLNDAQVVELARLDTGVAAVYQNGWLSPVLCQIDKYEHQEQQYEYHPVSEDYKAAVDAKAFIIRFLLKDHLNERIEYNLEEFNEKISSCHVDTWIKAYLFKTMKEGSTVDFENAAHIINSIFFSENALLKSKTAANFEDWNREMLSNMDESIKNLEPVFQAAVLQCLLSENARKDEDVEKFYFGWVDYMKGGLK